MATAERLELLRKKKRLAQLRAKKRGVSSEQEYSDKLTDNDRVMGFNNDLNDIRFITNLLSTGNIIDIPAHVVGLGADTKINTSRRDAETAGTYILNEKMGIPGKVIYDHDSDKFVISAKVTDKGGNIVTKTFRMDQQGKLDNPGDLVNAVLSKANAIGGELLQEGPRIAAGLFGLAALTGSLVLAGAETATGALSPGAIPTVGAGLAVDLGSQYVGNLASEGISSAAFKAATDGKEKREVGNPFFEAAFTTATDAPVASVGGRAIGAGAKMVGAGAKAVGGTILDNVMAALPKLGPKSYKAVMEGLDTLDNWGDFVAKKTGEAGANVGKVVGDATEAVSNFSMPLVKGMARQIGKMSTVPAESGTAGAIAAIFGNANKAAFNRDAFLNTNSIEELLEKSKTDLGGFIEDLKVISKDPELRNVYQTQIRNYAGKLVRDLKEEMTGFISGNRATRDAKIGTLTDSAQEATESQLKNIDSKIEQSIKNIEGLETQARQSEEGLSVLQKELDTYNTKLDDIATQRNKMQSEQVDFYSDTKTGVPKEETGFKLKTELYEQNKRLGSEKDTLYRQAEEAGSGRKLIDEELETLQEIVDPVVNEKTGNFSFNKFDSGSSPQKIKTFFDPIGYFDEEGKFIYKAGITEKDIANFKSNLNSSSNFFTGETPLSGSQQAAVIDLNKRLDQDIIEPLANEPGFFQIKKQADTAYKTQSAVFPQENKEALFGKGTRELDEQTSKSLGVAEGSLEFGSTGVETYNNFMDLIETDPKRAISYFEELSPELQNEIRRIEQLDLLDGVADRKVGKDHIIGTKEFDLPEQRTSLEGSVKTTQSGIDEAESYISKLSKEIDQENLNIEKATFSQEKLPTEIARDTRAATELVDSTDAANATGRRYEAEANLDYRGIDTSPLENVEGQIAENIQADRYTKALPAKETTSGQFAGAAEEAGYKGTSLYDLQDVLGFDAALKDKEAYTSFVLDNPNYLAQMADDEIAQMAADAGSGPVPISNLADFSRVLGSGVGYGATGSAAVGNLVGAGTSSATKTAAGGFLPKAWESINRGINRYAELPTAPLINRLPADNIMLQGPVDMLPFDNEIQDFKDAYFTQGRGF